MRPIFGVHTGLQNTTVDDLRSLWHRIEELGFDWISIWDHFYSADFTGAHCLEAVSAHAALACETTRVRVGSLVYCAGYRHPAVLANAITTIDHLSGGRADIGLGAGWAHNEYAAYGIDFPRPGVRLDILEESVQCVRGLLRDDTTDFSGEHFQLTEARCEPKPIQPELPIWIGGGGEKRTLKIAGRYADGWNIPFPSPEAFAHKREVLAGHAADAGRSIDDIRCAVNVGLCPTDADLDEQFGGLAVGVRAGVLMGSEQQMVEHLGRYVEAGAQQINLAMRAPWQLDHLEMMAAAIGGMD
ncbi:MAG: TIGR03560 family F420-dependent LLM class oxidoreductase [Acidimicrobiia bacterium]|nr:TIGR03560 family F420-dependent LLM class oxidoreductase [Acidimicrobiia bacterium]